MGSWLANNPSPFARLPIKPKIGEENVLFHPPSHKSHTFLLNLHMDLVWHIKKCLSTVFSLLDFSWHSMSQGGF